MKHQQVSVDYWAMGKSMVTYGVLTVLCWFMLRMFNMVFTLPGRMRAQQDRIQDSLKELQKRFPDLNITEDDIKNAEKELEAFVNKKDEEEEKTEGTPQPIEEDKKTI